jgi:hypothetical protein
MKTFTFHLFAAPALLLLILSSHIAGQTNISGNVSGVWTPAGSPYMIVGDTYVPADSALLIEAGVSVQFTGEFVLAVSGNIQAIGAEQDSIEFRPVDTGMYTKGLHILNGQDTCRLKYCIFENFKEQTDLGNHCYKGGALYANDTRIIINYCNFRINQLVGCFRTGRGGAICLDSCSGNISHSRFVNNGIINILEYIEAAGGAIYCSGNGVEIRNNIINMNYINLWLGDWYDIIDFDAYGGGVYTEGVVINNIIQENYCKTYGHSVGYTGSVWVNLESKGGGIFGGATLVNNFIKDNYCQANASAGSVYEEGLASAYSHGGGIFGGTTINNNIISGNWCSSTAYGDVCSAESFGGGISDCELSRNNLITSNQCSSVASEDAASKGGGAYNTVICENTTFSSNAISGSGFSGTTILGSALYSGIVNNCILYGNTPSLQASDAYVAYSCVQGGCWGPGNISDDPLFVTGPKGDYYLSQLAAGQTQQSPCVDAGDPNGFVYLGTTRTDTVPDLGIIDMGYHYPAQFGFTGKDNHEVSAFSISQIMDAPNTDQIKLCLELPVKDRVTIRIYNLLGQQVAGYENTFDAGKHILNFYPGKERCYILSARASGMQKSIKLIGKGGGGGPCRLVGP